MKKAVVYARISVTSEESVSVERQIEAAEQYAAARGWQVVGRFVDDGVSATKNKPEDRVGWRALLDSSVGYDKVVIWKVDRLARRVLDFLHADEALQARGAGLVAVEDPIDMTTAQGRAFATMLAVFGEMEAAAISARVKAARTHLLKSGRVVGGTIQYGWKSKALPGGGYVLAQDPEAVQWVRAAADRTLAGHSLYSTAQWLTESGVPTATWRVPFVLKPWGHTTIDRLLRNPVMAGMTAFNPGNESKRRGDDVLRGEDGLPVVDESVAIMEVAEWRRMVALLDDNDAPQARPRAMKAKTSGLLSGLVFCGDARHAGAVRMWRGTVQGREGYSCPECHHTISNFEDAVIAEFLAAKGTWVRWTPVEEVYEGGAALLPEIEHRLDELEGLIRAASSAERVGLMAQQATLLDERDARRSESPVVKLRYEEAGVFAADWAAAGDDTERRAVLDDALERVVVRRGRPGRRAAGAVLSRLEFQWREPAQVGPPEDRSATG